MNMNIKVNMKKMNLNIKCLTSDVGLLRYGVSLLSEETYIVQDNLGSLFSKEMV